MRKHIFIVLASVLALASAVARANLITNGGFETGDLSGWTTSNLQNGTGAAISGFAGYPSHSGDYFAALGNVTSLGFLSQTLATTVGTPYTISLYLASNGITPNEFDIEWDGATLFDQTDIPAQPYTQYSFNVVGTGSDTLTLSELDPLSYLALDDVSVNPTVAVAEPAPLSVLGGAVLAFGVLWHRRRRAWSRTILRSR